MSFPTTVQRSPLTWNVLCSILGGFKSTTAYSRAASSLLISLLLADFQANLIWKYPQIVSIENLTEHCFWMNFEGWRLSYPILPMHCVKGTFSEWNKGIILSRLKLMSLFMKTYNLPHFHMMVWNLRVKCIKIYSI